MPQRFLTLTDVAEILNTSDSQVYALVRRGDLPAIKIGGRGQWRVEAAKLEDYIARMYTETETFVDEHPWIEPDEVTGLAQPGPVQRPGPSAGRGPSAGPSAGRAPSTGRGPGHLSDT